ncbi:MAG: magnesium/cobalt transporter CorA [Psychroflexus sp.]
MRKNLQNLKYPKRLKIKKRKIQNQIPGQITYIGEKPSDTTEIDVISYNTDKVKYDNNCSVERVSELINHDTDFKHWINFSGLHDVEKLGKLGQLLNIHPLVLEDIANTRQRPKLDEFEDYLFMALKMLYYTTENEFVKEHFGIILHDSYIITFQQNKDDVLNFVRERVHNKTGRIRTQNTDYLFFAIIDAVIDNYYNITETVEEKTEDLEDKILSDANSASSNEIQMLKREILSIRKSVAPTKELINRLQNSKHKLFDKSTRFYLADLYDHILQVTENVDIYREITWGLLDMHMSSMSNKMNEVMKVLTIMSTIFIPLTFIVGVYGMNFEYMPELDAKSGYFIVWAVMIALTVLLIFYFKKKKWF